MAILKQIEGNEPIPCYVHPTKLATRRCNICGQAICDTCLFQFQTTGDTCPECATKKPEIFTSRRTQMLYWCFGLGGLSIVLTAAMFFSAMFQNMEETLLGVLFLLILILGVVGLSLAVSNLDKRRGNPPSVWIAFTLNLIPVVILGVAMIVGVMMGA